MLGSIQYFQKLNTQAYPVQIPAYPPLPSIPRFLRRKTGCPTTTDICWAARSNQQGLNYWVGQMQMGVTDENVIARIIASDEFFNDA